jgi:hypothetical protein
MSQNQIAGTESVDPLEVRARVLVHIPDPGHVSMRSRGRSANRPRRRWWKAAPADGAHGFVFFWHPLDEPASSEWHSVFQEAPEQLRQLLPIRS